MASVKKIFLRAPYNYDMNEASDESALHTGKDSPVKQSFKDECDINTIVNRFGLGYEIPEGLTVPQYGDFTGINDFHDALNKVAAARENFEAMPASIRSRFDNDPGKFVDFALDTKNADAMKEMGLLNKQGLERLQKAADERKAAANAATIKKHLEAQKTALQGEQVPPPAQKA